MEEYLLLNCKENILRILRDENGEKHFAVNINFLELFETDTDLGHGLLKDPEEVLQDLDNWILHTQDLIREESPEKDKLIFKDNLHARVYGLPVCPELYRTVFPRAEDVESFLQIKGTVVKTKDPKILEYQRPYRCAKCKYTQMVEGSYDQKYIITPPKRCSNPESCQGKNLIHFGTLSVENCKDFQEIKIQEQASNLNSTMPSSLWVTLEDDLVDLCKPGDDVTICGTVKRRWDSFVTGKPINVELSLKANHIQVHNGNTVPSIITAETREQFTTFWQKYEKSPLEGRDIILKSFCSKLYGMYLVKLAMAVVLSGGSSTYGSGSGSQKRSESHILLVGDPGTGKSQLLRYSSKIVSRSVLTTGIGTTSAGLTAAAVMEDGHWQLEAGALVLADGGICCIDEFNSMKPNDRASIHEAMEQQTISVAKAGIHCKLRTRCSILAATNPKGGHLDDFQSLSLNLAIPSPLLSRFDIILMLKDAYKYEWDSKIAEHIVSGKSFSNSNVEELWPLETLQQYFIFVKTINPPLSAKADRVLAAYYQAQRQGSARNKSRTTVRLLESLIRLSQGHARLMCHHEVDVMDAIFSIILTESSMHGECAVLSLEPLNVLESFSDAPMRSYANLSRAVLSKLDLNDEVLQSEIEFSIKDEQEDSLNSSVLSDINEPIFSSTQRQITKVVVDFHGPETQSSDNSVCSSNRNETLRNYHSQINNNFSSAVNSSNTLEILNNKRKKCDNKNDANVFNLMKSVNDDFDLNLLTNDEHNRIDESQNTKRKNIHKKFKWKPKQKIPRRQVDENEECHVINTEKNDNEINEYNFNGSPIRNDRFDDFLNPVPSTSSKRSPAYTTNHVDPEKTPLKQYNNVSPTPRIEIAEKTKKTPMKDFKSTFAFKPRNPPPNPVPDNQPEDTVVKENCLSNSIFEDSEDINMDLLDFDN